MLRAAVLALCLAALLAPAGAVDLVQPNYVNPGDDSAAQPPRDGTTNRVQPPAATGGRAHRANDCHGSVAEHFVPEFGRVVRHRHAGPACRPVLVDPDDLEPAYSSDCHRDAREHWLPGSNGRVLHRHVGEDCAVRVIRRSTGG